MFGETNIARNSAKSEHICSGYVISLDGLGLWSFGNDFDRNVVITNELIISKINI